MTAQEAWDQHGHMIFQSTPPLGWVIAFLRELDAKTYGVGLDVLTERAEARLGAHQWRGREVIRQGLRASGEGVDGRFLELPGVGHWQNREALDRFNAALLGFLRDFQIDDQSVPKDEDAMTALVVAVRIFCFLPFLTGLADLLLGAQVFELSGLTFPDTIAGNPALNSQIGFWGAIWFGMGLLLWRSTTDLVTNKDWFILLCGIIFLSGVGRAIAAVRFGLPSTPLTAAMALELIGMPLAMVWHRAVLQRFNRAPALGN